MSFPSFVCWKSSFMGMSDAKSSVAISDVADAAFIISAR